MAQRKIRRDAVEKPRCEDCYFRRNGLCALDLDEPCATFRPDRPEGLVPPRQPVLLMRAPRWAGSDPSRPLPHGEPDTGRAPRPVESPPTEWRTGRPTERRPAELALHG